LIPAEQVESIEIMKGQQTLYGSGAAAGVINITLKPERKNGNGLHEYRDANHS
jgi:vitamin B12 transporter